MKLEPPCQDALEKGLAERLSGCTREDGTPLDFTEGAKQVSGYVKSHDPNARAATR